jgi:hypothetical protein
MNKELEMTRKEVLVAQLLVLSWHLCGRTGPHLYLGLLKYEAGIVTTQK